MTSSSVSLLDSRLFRLNNIFYCLVAICLFYLFLSNFLYNMIISGGGGDSSDDRAHAKLQNDKKQLSYQDEIVLIRRKIFELESELDRSIQSVQNLTMAIRQYNKTIYNELFEDENAKQKQSNNNNNIINNNGAVNETRRRDDKRKGENMRTNRIAVLMFACNRPKAADDHLRDLFAKRANSKAVDKFPIIVSQDCNHEETANAIRAHSGELYAFLQHPDHSDIATDERGNMIPVHLRGYYKISRHYKWALEQVFMRHGFQSVIITEDDLFVADDFFDYFQAMQRVLLKDQSLFCVSAWNDNGKAELIDTSNGELVHRSDFFPGLGWMMTRSFWIEIRKKWPRAFWDDWMRDSAQRKGRACLRPEISRTHMSKHSARQGVSGGQFYDTFLQWIVINKNVVDWPAKDNSYLLKSNYDPAFLDRVYGNTTEKTFNELLTSLNQQASDQSFLLTYSDKGQFESYARYFKLMDDFKNGVPRTAYKGVVRIFYKSNTIYIAPEAKREWKGYDPSW